ncbi:MAG: Ig-like domain-containing protein [Chitinophagaceae bacterium]|jgi:uncharacterized protein YjdB
MKKTLLLFLFSLLIFNFNAQSQLRSSCGFDIVHKQRLLADKEYDSSVSQMNARWKAYSALASSAMLTYTASGYVYEIPIVVHVLHTGGAVGTVYNPDSTTLAGMVDYLNKSYAATSPFPDTTTGSSGGGTRIPLKFVLAKRTPTGGSTNGIIRINASTTLGSTYTTYGINAATSTGVTVSAVTALSRWNSADYYNVYVVNKIDGNDLTSSGGIAGFAYFPGSPTVDGMYVVASQAKTGTTTVSHEFGHAFSLYHTFEGDADGTTCPSTSSCSTTGDLVCDTEPHIRESSAFPSTWCPPTDVNACTGLSYNKTQFNIMDYTTCPPNRYTAGQRTRVLNTLDNERIGYKTSSGLLDPSGTIATIACTPTATSPGFPIGPYIVDFNGMNVWTGSSGMEDATYIDHAYTQQTVVNPGSTYTLSISTKTNAQNVKAFIDYNNDGDFVDAGEEVFSHSATIASGDEVHSGSFSISTSAVKCTYLRMRVVAEYAGSTITNWSCGPYVYGQAEDYGVYVRSVAPTVTTPVAYCVGDAASALTATGSNLKWYTVATGGTGSSTITPLTSSAGSTKYYVSQSGDASATCESVRDSITVNVTAAPSISGTLSACFGGSSVTLTGSGTAHATTPWTSSNTSVVTISSGGVVSVVGVGSSTITYKNNNNCTKTATFTVNALPSISGSLSVCLGSSPVTLTGSGTADATTPWTSSNTSVATISSAGVVTVVGAGSTTITYKNNIDCSNTATFVVNALPSISGTLTASVGASSALSGSGTAHPTTPWTSSGVLIATVSSTGVVTGVSPGTTTITYKNNEGCEKSVTFTVTPSSTITGILSTCIGASSTLTGVGTPHATTPWSSGTHAVATVSSTGVVTGVSAGTSVITFKDNAGTDYTETFTVFALPTISGTLSACVGKTSTLTGSATADTTTPWASSNAAVATVSSAGVVTGISGGTATITYKNLNGCTQTATFTVNALPSSPSVTTPVTYCQADASPSALSATLASTTDTLYWYTVATGGTGTTVVPTPSTATAQYFKYYVGEKNTIGCESPRTAIDIRINPKPALVTATPLTSTSFCVGDSVTLNGSISVLSIGNSDFLKGSAASGSPFACDCPNGSVVVGYEGSTGSLIDQFRLICKPINRFGILGATTSATTYNGTGAGPVSMGPYTFAGTGMMVGLKAIGTDWPDPLNLYTFLGGATGYGQTQTFVTGFGNNSSGPSVLTSMNGWSSTGDYGTVYVPDGTVANGMYSYTGSFARGVALRYVPVGAYKYNYSWSTGDTNASITVNTTGSYSLTVTNSYGCSATSSPVVVNSYAYPTAPTVSSPVYYCTGGTASALTATKSVSTDTLLWYTSASGGTGSTTAPTPLTGTAGTTNYYVSEKNAGGCESPRKLLAVTVTPPVAPFEIKTLDSVLCLGESTSLNVGVHTKDSISSTWSSGWIVNDGIMFDVEAKKEITINGFDIRLNSTTTSPDLYVYYKKGTHVGSELISSDWTLLGHVTPALISGVLFKVPLSLAINLSTGERGAFYFAYDGAAQVGYRGGTSVGSVTVEDSSIKILDGRGTFAPLFASAASPRSFIGNIRYTNYSAVWNTLATTDDISVSPTVTTKYWAKITNWLGCSATDTIEVQVNPLPTISGTLSACVGSTSALTGSATAHPTTPWTSSATGVATVSTTGVVTAVAAGTTTITYMNSNDCIQTATFTVNPLPTIIGTLSACVGATSTLTGSATAHATTPWTSSATSVATISSTGVVTAVAAGTTTITYMNTNGCTQTATFTVNPLPTISGTLSACVGSTSALTGSATAHATTPWTSSATSVATISSTGVVTAVAAGTTTITYMNTNGCTQTANFTVNALPTITGTLNACIGSSSTLTGSATAHATTPWSSSATGVATISSAGVVTAVSAGTTTITYMNTDGCINTATFTVNPLPTIGGTLVACVGQTSTLTGSATAHATTPWTSSATGVATVSSTGVVTGVAGGTTTITYMNTNGCTQTATFTVNPLPTISGTLNACIGSSSTLSGSATPHATTPWTSSNTGVATISGAGVVSTVAVGTTTITYRNTNNCTQTATFTVNALPAITGTLSTCIGATTALTGSATAHATTPWASSATGVATVSSTGVVTGVTSGTATITYMNSNGCSQSVSVTVNPLPTISGTLVACVGQTSALTGSATPHATTPWTSSSTSVATVSSTGVVTAVAGGTTTITYRNTNNCTQTATFTVNALPTISGTLNTCVGLTSTLTGSATAHTTTPWTSSNTSVATVSSSGVVTGVAVGTSTITYRNTNNCVITATFTVNPVPVAPTVTTPVNLCIGVTASALTATGTNLKWYTVATGGTASTVAPIPSTASLTTLNYWVSQTTAAGCEGPRANITAVVQPSPVLTITSLSTHGFLFCKNLTVTLKGTSATANTWQWDSTGINVSGATTDTLAVGTAGKWGLTVASVYGCKKREEVTVYQDSSSIPILSPPSSIICEEGSALLTCSPGFTSYTFDWMKDGLFISPATPKDNLKNASVPGLYAVKVTNRYGCIDTTNLVSVTTYPKPLKPTITNTPPVLSLSAGPYTYYQWYRDGSIIVGANTRNYTYTSNGTYFAQITDANGCLNNSDTIIIKNLSIDKANTNAYTIKVYPNPTNNLLNIEAPIKVNVQMTDALGRLVFEGKEVKQINMGDFADGNYFLRITDDKNQIISIEKINKLTK